MTRALVAGLVALGIAGCDAAPLSGPAHPAQDSSYDGDTFSPEFLLADQDFEDATFLSADAVQAFFVRSPYGASSFLASYTDKGRSAADLVVAASVRHRVSAILLLARLERDGILVAARRYPDEAKTVEYVFGYGCSGRVQCDPSLAGLGTQLDALAGDLRRALDDVRRAGVSANGFGPGISAKTLDGVTVTPATAATAALYALEPLVNGAAGGQALTWSLFRSYAAYLGYVPVANPAGGGTPP